MNCEAIQKMLPALAGGDLERAAADRCEGHLRGCADCTARLEGLRQTLSLLRQVGRSEVPPPGFGAALHRRLAGTPPPVPSWSARLWGWAERMHVDSGLRLSFVGVAVLALLAVPVAMRGRGHGGGGQPVASVAARGGEQEVAAAFRVPQQRVAVVRFDFVAAVEIADVEFEVTLPSELHFIDGSEPVPQKRLVWRGSLSSGSNPVPLAISGSQPGRYRVTAHARGDGVDVQHDILLEVVRS